MCRFTITSMILGRLLQPRLCIRRWWLRHETTSLFADWLSPAWRFFHHANVLFSFTYYDDQAVHSLSDGADCIQAPR